MLAFAHQLQLQPRETVLQFETRLRKEGKDGNFGADFGNQIRDAVLCKCGSDYVRLKLLEEREELTLVRTLELAEQCERGKGTFICIGFVLDEHGKRSICNKRGNHDDWESYFAIGKI